LEKIIHMTCKEINNIENIIWRECLSRFNELYSDYTIKLYGNVDIYTLINKYYPEHLDNVKKIEVGAVLADIFRYLILYLEGGIYSDMDVEPLKKIDNLHKINEFDIVVGYEFFPTQICQWFIYTKPKQRVFLECYLQCISNIENLINLDKKSIEYNNIIMNNCGPQLFTKKIKEDKFSNIKILPEDYFCCGSGGYVPLTTNSYIKHYFTSSWR